MLLPVILTMHLQKHQLIDVAFGKQGKICKDGKLKSKQINRLNLNYFAVFSGYGKIKKITAEKRFVVPRVGLEPTHLAAGDFESPASTNFATWAGDEETAL